MVFFEEMTETSQMVSCMQPGWQGSLTHTPFILSVRFCNSE